MIDDVKETLAKTTVDEEIEKLKEQMDSAQSFYNFQQEFHEDYQHLTKKPQQAQLYKFNHTYYYNYLLNGDDYHILMSIPPIDIVTRNNVNLVNSDADIRICLYLYFK